MLLAQSCRSVGFKVCIVDANAENLSKEQILKRIDELSPRIICLVVYGQNVNAGTTNMRGAVDITNFLKANKISYPIAYIGSHVQASTHSNINRQKKILILFLQMKVCMR